MLFSQLLVDFVKRVAPLTNCLKSYFVINKRFSIAFISPINAKVGKFVWKLFF